MTKKMTNKELAHWLQTTPCAPSVDPGMFVERCAEIARRLRAMSWRPIEEAPRDGSWFLARMDDGTICEAHFVNNSKTAHPWSGFMPASMRMPINKFKPVLWLSHDALPQPPEPIDD